MASVVIGVTGHRNIVENQQLVQAVTVALEQIAQLCPTAPKTMLCSLAQGSDQLCAEIALKLGFSLICPMPRPRAAYREDFSGATRERFDMLLKHAEEVFVAPPMEPYYPGESFGYRQAGIYVATHCHALLALWDGSPAKPDGCGTAEAVAFARGLLLPHHAAPPVAGCAVWQIVTPRQNEHTPPEPYSLRVLEQTAGSNARLLQQIEQTNQG